MDGFEFAGQGLDNSGLGGAPPGGMVDEAIKNNVSIYELEQIELIEKIKHVFAGEVWDRNEGKWVQVHKARANDEGIGHILTIIAAHLDKNITLSELDIFQISRMTFEVTSAVIGVIFMKHNEYEIGPEDRDIIVNVVEHHVYANYMRALNGGERRHRETVIKSVESIVERQSGAQKESGLFGKMNLFRHNKGRE